MKEQAMADGPMDQIRTLAYRVKQATGDLGIEFVGFSIIPAMDGVGPDIMQCVFRLYPDALLTEDERIIKFEKAKLDADFEALMAGVGDDMQVDNEDEKVKEARAATLDLLKGFLDDKE
jgi:hypothetical protein